MVTWHEGLAESRVRLAVKVRNCLLPLVLESRVVVWRHGDEGGTGVDDGWVGLCLALVLE